MIYLLLGLAWLVIVLAPAFLASRQPVESKDGYSEFTADDLMQPQPVSIRAKKR